MKRSETHLILLSALYVGLLYARAMQRLLNV